MLEMFLFRAKAYDIEDGAVVYWKDFSKRLLGGPVVILSPDDDGMKQEAIKKVAKKITVVERILDHEKLEKTTGLSNIKYCDKLGNKQPDEYVFYDKENNFLASYVLPNGLDEFFIDEPLEKFVLCLEDLAYQKIENFDALKEFLSENCAYSEDKETVRKMVETGILDSKFIYKWVDSETIFLPWW